MAVYFIEHLTPRTWRRIVWRRLVRDGSTSATTSVRVWFVDATPAGEALARRMVAGTTVVLARFDFEAAMMHDADGKLVWLRIYYEDMAQALAYVKRQIAFRNFIERPEISPRLTQYLFKQVLPGSAVIFPHGLWRALYLLHACLWQARREGMAPTDAVLFLEARPWMDAFMDYAQSVTGATVLPASHVPVLLPLLARLMRRDIRMWSQRIGRAMRGTLTALMPTFAIPGPPCIALQYYGHFNVNEPDRHSDFFFWQCSTFPGKNLLALFDMPADPLDAVRNAELSAHQIRAVALRHDATTLSTRYVCAPSRLARALTTSAKVLIDIPWRDDGQWLRSEARAFALQCQYWRDVFKANNVKVFTTWFKYNADHCAIAEAIDSLGGALAVYQRSYEGNGTAQAALSSDICFAFSRMAEATEAAAGSRIDHCVITGYLGDHRFAVARKRAAPVRASLRAAGASYIAAYFDENSGDDHRWVLGHERERRHYDFLLEKVLADAHLGLVLKPKSPSTLRRRLGPTAAKLDRALATGRCHIYEDGLLQGSITPAQAALSADLTIHGSVAAATAGVEAALAGAPVALLDEDGWSISPLNRLGRGRVIFDDWEALWHTWSSHRESLEGTNGFADWSCVLDELDPFRDGRAAERMGTYLLWLIEGFAAGRNKFDVLSDATARYVETWGSDKVFCIRPTQPRLPS